ncbi:MAG: VOC family protein [Culicoidibacterales bacterium]
MSMGKFSVSLKVADISKSKAFYQKIGFEVVQDQTAQKWMTLKNGTTTIGLFEGILEQNMLTFCPGWDSENQLLPAYDDVRILAQKFENQGINITGNIDQTTTGPAYFSLVDPDGNVILIDQHV